ncbi:MAG TPA: NAD(P)-dependent oxidoreductase [Verrucomicrobiae bacterium]|nr:NAD(P)-dependent oxidoreductase [Verrucomicrobiae bacterium]
MKALITGGAGFVGRHVCARLEKMGYAVTIVDNFYPGAGCVEPDRWMDHLQPNWSRVRLVREDCRQFFRHSSPRSDKYDVIVHLAAVVGGRLVIEGDPLAVGLDLSIDAEFFYWLSRLTYQPQRIHYFSSSAAYPVAYQRTTGHRALTEEMIRFHGEFIGQADLTYGWSKLTGEYLAQLTHQKHGHHITCYRPFSGYGEDQDSTYPFPSILGRALRGEKPMTVWGSGKQMRDFIHIDDCVEGMLTLGEQVGDGSAVNLSTGIPTSFNEFAGLAWEAVHGSRDGFAVRNTSAKPEGVFARYGSTELQHQLGFRHRLSLRAGIEHCLNLLRGTGVSAQVPVSADFSL